MSNKLPPLDNKLHINEGRIPEWYRDSIVDINDTLELCWLSAQQVFGTEAKPEQALALLPTVLAEAARLKARTMSQFGRNMDGDAVASDQTQ